MLPRGLCRLGRDDPRLAAGRRGAHGAVEVYEEPHLKKGYQAAFDLTLPEVSHRLLHQARHGKAASKTMEPALFSSQKAAARGGCSGKARRSATS